MPFAYLTSTVTCHIILDNRQSRQGEIGILKFRHPWILKFDSPEKRSSIERIGHQQPVIFGVMDLTSGYHQAPMDQRFKVLTAFICYCGVYQFTRLPFGPRRAPSYFQEMMATIVLNGLIYICCEMYLDDCIVFARGQDEFLERLERVFRRFRCFGLLLKAKKCRFGMSQIDYVGRQISSQGISM